MFGAGMMVVTGEPRPANESAAPAGPFDITIVGRTISLRHRSTGHIYEYLWFRSAPHLRCGQIREEQEAKIPARRLSAEARHAALLELQQARLVEPPTNGFGVGSSL
jgi:hypothetical protein